MSFPSTTPQDIRQALIERIGRIQPRHERNRDQRWHWVGDAVRGDVTGATRNFDVVLDTEVVVPGGAYGDVIEYSLPAVIRVSYVLEETDMQRTSGADGQDLVALLVQFHAAVPGLVPVAMEGGQILVPSRHRDRENAYVIDFAVAPGLRFFAPDTVDFHPED